MTSWKTKYLNFMYSIVTNSIHIHIVVCIYACSLFYSPINLIVHFGFFPSQTHSLPNEIGTQKCPISVDRPRSYLSSAVTNKQKKKLTTGSIVCTTDRKVVQNGMGATVGDLCLLLRLPNSLISQQQKKRNNIFKPGRVGKRDRR